MKSRILLTGLFLAAGLTSFACKEIGWGWYGPDNNDPNKPLLTKVVTENFQQPYYKGEFTRSGVAVDELGRRINRTVTDYTYDGNYRTQEIKTTSDWNGKVQVTSLQEFEYDENGNQTATRSKSMDGQGGLVVQNETISEYDEHDRIVFTSTSYRDYQSNEMIENYKAEYSYDADGNSTPSFFYWNVQSGDWQTEDEYYQRYEEESSFVNSELLDEPEYFYKDPEIVNDENGNVISQVNYNYHHISGQYVKSYKVMYKYNEKGQSIEYMDQQWNHTCQMWANTGRNTTEFNEYDQQMLTEYYTWDGVTGDWVRSNRTTYTYMERPHEVLESTLEINVFPNPSRGIVNFTANTGESLLDIEVMDISGKQVLTLAQQQPRSDIDLSTLPNGNYVMQFSDGKVSATEKVTIAK